MILFYEDWKKYPNVIIDVKTTNRSFLELAMIYKKMGVKNHAFLLALHDPGLQGVDPYDPNISEEMIIRIWAEVKTNPWYFFREIARAPSSAGSDPFRFRANRGNIALFWLFFNHITSLLIQPRQTGKSFSTDVLMRLLLNVLCQNTKINLFTKDDKLRNANITRLKDIELELPIFMRLKTKKDADNTEYITVKALNNRYDTHVAQASIKAARNLGRGLTSPIFHVDEIAHIYNVEDSIKVALPATGAARDMAMMSGSPYGTIFTTTPGRLDSAAGKYVYNNIYTAGARWHEKFLDSATLAELEVIIRKNSRRKILTVILDFNHRQLGYTDEWLRGKMEEAQSDGIDAEIDFLNKWAAGNNSSPLSRAISEIIHKSKRDDYFNDISTFSYIIRWFIPEEDIDKTMSSTVPVISLDTSDAVGSDDIAMVIRCSKSGVVLGAGDFNETNLITFSEWLVFLLMRFPNAIMIIERRSSGVAIMDYIIKLLVQNKVDPFKRLFNWVVHEAAIYPSRFAEIDMPMDKRDDFVYTKYRKQFGYATSAGGRSSRDALYGEALTGSAKYTGHGVHDPALIAQIARLITKNGRIDHPVGEHDDLCIAWLLSYWFLSKAENVGFYGLSTRNILSEVISNNEGDIKQDIEEQINNREQQQLKATIDELLDYLPGIKDDNMAFLLSTKIKQLYKELDTGRFKTFNINSLLDGIETARKADKQKNR